MYTAGVVIVFAADLALSEESRYQLAQAGPFLLGEENQDCMAAVLEAEDPRQARLWHEWAAALPGVSSVNVVFVHWMKKEECDDRA